MSWHRAYAVDLSNDPNSVSICLHSPACQLSDRHSTDLMVRQENCLIVSY